MKTYNPANWYWAVGSDQTKVYSTVAGDYVPVADATFVAWSADGTRPTSIDSEASLGAVLAPLLLRPANASVLDGYATNQAGAVLQLTAFKIAFNHENRLRAIERALSLNGSPANLNPGQALAVVKALM